MQGTARTVLLGLVAAGLFALAAAGGCSKKAEEADEAAPLPSAPPESPELVLVSPHNREIEEEFERAFRLWHQRNHGSDVRFDWRDVGGTTTCTDFLISQYARSESSGVDVYFGGGAPDHRRLAGRGLLLPARLPEEVLRSLPETIGGIRQYDPRGRWHGAAVSCFGIFYNKRMLAMWKLRAPKTWDDLARPEMFQRIAAADATQSGSARAAYEMILQSAADWPTGWRKLLMIWGNCRRFTDGASDVVNDVTSGDVAAGAAIDFYAYKRMAGGGGDLGFAIVPGTTAFTPDPISLMKGAPHETVARRFMAFVLSVEGQQLWCLPPGVEGGPARHALYRQPIRPDVYRDQAGRMLDVLVDPFEHVGSFQYDEQAASVRIGRLIAPLMQAAALDNKESLRRAWKAVLDAGRPKALLGRFGALPPDLADEQKALATARTLSDTAARLAALRRWQAFFARQYEGVLESAGR